MFRKKRGNFAFVCGFLKRTRYLHILSIYKMKSFNSRFNLSDLAARQTGSLIDCGLSEDVLVVDQLTAGLFSEQTLQLGFIVYVFCSKGSAMLPSLIV